MKFRDLKPCPQLEENTARFETKINPILRQLKAYADKLPHSPAHEEEDWQDALIDLWQNLHFCPKGKEPMWAQECIARRYYLKRLKRYDKKKALICCELDEAKLCSMSSEMPELGFSSEMERLVNNVSCARTAKIVQRLAKLPELNRSIVLMHLDNFTMPEIAKELKLTKTATIYRFRQSIKAMKDAEQCNSLDR